jgi:hypothetical protein
MACTSIMGSSVLPVSTRCSRWRSLLLATSTSRQGIDRKDGGKSRLGWRPSPTPYPRCTPSRWNRHDRRQDGPPHEEIGGIKQHGNLQNHGRAHDVRGLRQCWSFGK